VTLCRSLLTKEPYTRVMYGSHNGKMHKAVIMWSIKWLRLVGALNHRSLLKKEPYTRDKCESHNGEIHKGVIMEWMEEEEETSCVHIRTCHIPCLQNTVSLIRLFCQRALYV